MDNLQHISSHSEVIDALFESTSAAARWAGLNTSAISNWRERGIPPGWHYRIDQYARQKGFAISPAVFGYVDTEEQKKGAA